MRKFILLVSLFAMQAQMFAGNIDSIFNEFKDSRKAEYVSVSPFLMAIGRMFMSDEEDDIAKRIRSIKVLDLEDCSSSVKERFNKKVSGLDKNDYETLMSVKEDDENVQILVKEKKNIIKEMVIVCGGKDDCALILIKGDIRPEDINKLVEQETEKIHGDK